MKSFKQFLLEYRDFQRTDKTSSVPALHSAGAYEPNSKGYINFTTYHGGYFGEKPGTSPTRRGFARTPAERMSVAYEREDKSGIAMTTKQPLSSFMGLSTTPDATAAREYRIRRTGEAPYVANPDTPSENEKLYELHGRVHVDNVKKFENYDEFEHWHFKRKHEVDSKLKKDKKLNKMLEDQKNLRSKLRSTGLLTSRDIDDHPEIEKISNKISAHRLAALHNHITDKHGVHVAIIGTNGENWNGRPGTGRARHSGEIMLFKPHETIHRITDRTSDVDMERERIRPAIERLGRIRAAR
jgi:hypothetical protein